MGEMADLALSSDQLIDDIWPEEYCNQMPLQLSCKYCNTSELYWRQVSTGGYRLCDGDGLLHSCANYWTHALQANED